MLCPDKEFTESHTIAINVHDLGGGEICAKKLEESGIIVNKNMLPGDKSAKHPDGIRIGTPEITRLGMNKSDMNIIAEFIKRILIDGIAPSIIKKEITDFKRSHNKISYCFYEGENPYKYYRLV